MESRLIITAASERYAPVLLAMLGSLRVNWPEHPNVLVYDLGLEIETIRKIEQAKIEVKLIPPFCEHWRKHFAWKIWCCQDAPCESYLWLDAGVCVLRPFPEAFVAMESLGYFCQPNGFVIKDTACKALRLHFPEIPFEALLSINANVHGFSKIKAAALLAEAFELCQREELMASDHFLGRHDQDLLSVLLFKHFSPILFSDRQLYAEHTSPEAFNLQRVWAHRRHMQPEDLEYFEKCLQNSGLPRIPAAALKKDESWLWRMRVAVAKLRGRFPENDKTRSIYNGVR